MAGPLRTTLGQFLINEELPEELRDYNRVLDKKGIGDLLRQIAQDKPDQYRRISHRLNQIGRQASYLSGGNSFGLAHMRKALAAKDIQGKIKEKLRRVLDDDGLDDDKREQLVLSAVGKHMKDQQERIFEESWAEQNPLSRQIHSGSRGNKMNLASLRGSDLLYSDHHDRVIPIPILSSYSEGFSPAEYWAGAYGARKGIMASKFATQDAGFLSKQLNQVAHRLMVTGEDDDEESDTLRGLPVDTEDEANEGSLLAADAGPYKRNTTLTPKILRDLAKRKIKRLLVRSPIVGGSKDGGLYARDVGIREDGRLPVRGTNVGLTAAQSLSEPLSQAQLEAKHSGGVAGEEKAVGGFDYINQIVQAPKRFKGGAAHAQVDGKVQDIKPGPAGGFHVTVNGERHYVGKDYALKVKKGDVVEAGDVISEGAPNPAEVVKHKGIGEGRRYFVKAYLNSYRDAGLRAHRRNVEMLARGLINHVKLDEEMGNFVPGDVVSYSAMERQWEPRANTQDLDPKRAIGRYLEKPYLHYSIGTRVRPSVVKDLNDFGVSSVATHAEPPPFEAEMIRGMYSLQHDPDWMTRMYGSGLKGSLLKGVHRGASSTDQGTSFVPGLSKSVNFGRTGLVRTPQEHKIERGQRSVPVSQGLMNQKTTNPTQDDENEIKFSADCNILKQAAGMTSPFSVTSWFGGGSDNKAPKSQADANYTGTAGHTSGTTQKPNPPQTPSSFVYDRAASRTGRQQQQAQAAADNYAIYKPWTWSMLGGSGGEVKKPTGRQVDYQSRPGYGGGGYQGAMPFMGAMSPQQQAAFARGTGIPTAGIGMMASPQLMSKILGGQGAANAGMPTMSREQFRQGLTDQGFTVGSGNLGNATATPAGGAGYNAINPYTGESEGIGRSILRSAVDTPYWWGGGGAGGWLGKGMGQMVGEGISQLGGKALGVVSGPGISRALGAAGGIGGAIGLTDFLDYHGLLGTSLGGTGLGQGWYNRPEGGSAMNTQQVAKNMQTMMDPNASWVNRAGSLLHMGTRPFTAAAYAQQQANQLDRSSQQRQQTETDTGQRAEKARQGSLDPADLQSFANRVGMENMSQTQLDAYMQTPTMRQAVASGVWKKDPASGQWVDGKSGKPLKESMQESQMHQNWANQRQQGYHFWQDPSGQVQSKPIQQMTPEEAARYGILPQEHQKWVQQGQADQQKSWQALKQQEEAAARRRNAMQWQQHQTSHSMPF